MTTEAPITGSLFSSKTWPVTLIGCLSPSNDCAEATGKWKNHVDNTAAEERKARTIYQVYRTDYVGNSRVDDFVMSQYTSAGRHKRTGMEYILLEESFATDYAYIDKKEFKQLRNDNKVDKSIEELLRFEKVNKIPPLAPNLQTAIDQLFKKDRTE